MIRIKTFAVAIGGAIALATAAPASAQKMEETSMALPALTLGFSSTYVAEAMGFWTKRGLKVVTHDIVGIGSMNAVLAGSVDFTNSSGPTVLRANIRGRKVLGIGSTYDGLPFELVVAPELMKKAGVTISSPIEKRAAVIKGIKISVTSPNTIPHAYLRYFARKGGIDPERDIQVVSMPPEAGLAALKNGTIQGYVQGPPWPQIATQQKIGTVLDAAILGTMPEMVPFAFNIVAAKHETCEKRPSVCRKLMAGYLDGMNYMVAHQQEALKILAKKMPKMDPAVLKSAFELIVKGTPRTTKINVKGMENAQIISIRGGMLKPDEKLSSFDAIYTNKYAQ